MPTLSAERTLLNPDYRDILSVFSDEKVEYLLVGAYALAAHGFVRATGDIDLWARPSLENAKRVMRALARFGAPLSEVSVEDFRDPGIVFQMGIAPRRIDILTMIDGVDFDEAWQDRKEIEVDGLPVHVISKLHLAKNKESTGRPQDKVDLEWLKSQSGDEGEGGITNRSHYAKCKW
jgi:hypothetical protein